MKTSVMNRVAAFLALVLVGAAGAASAPSPAPLEKADLSPDQLLRISTHVIVGEVKQVWTREESGFNWDWTRYVAEIAVESVEKGEGIAAGGLVYVRYWTKRWDGFGAPPPDTNGHRGLPSPGDRVRAHLARGAYDGFGKTDDGGFNVIGANGFSKP